MNRTTRSVAAAALAGVVALGAVAPAVAAPPEGAGKPDKVAAEAEKQQSKADKREEKVESRLERMATRKAGYLDRLSKRHKVMRLGDLESEALVKSMKRDSAFLTDLVNDTDDGAEAPEDLDTELTVAQLVRSARPVVYQRIINQVRLIVANDLDGVNAATDVTGEPQAAVEDLLDTVLAYNAWTPKSELKATQKQIADLLDTLEESDEADELEELEEAEEADEPEESDEPAAETTTDES